MFLHEVFDEVVRRHAGRVAVEVPPSPGRPGRVAWTYDDLSRASEEVAALLEGTVRGEGVVAILLPRESPHLFAAQLGISRAGAAWTCLDPAYPDEHLRFLLEDSEAVALLTDAAGLSRPGAAALPRDRVHDVTTRRVPPRPGATPTHAPAWLGESSLAYVIHTSGTTGRPKGVAVEHKSIVNLVRSDVEEFRLGPADRVAQSSSAAYDSSIEETWLAFASGATLVVLDDATVRLGPDLVPWLRAERITVFCPPPTLLRATGCADPRAALPDLRLLYVGGEALPPEVAARWGPGRRLENGYGPTECTVTVLRATVREGGPITIGRPVEGNRAHVLDERLEETAEGEPGELCIAGIGLARGYLRRDALTAERFPVHPHFGRLYRTGDLVRRDAHGDHHYLGRVDAQVKLRGHRIELGEVEAALAACPGVRAAACRVQGSGAAEVLAGWVVPVDPALPPRVADLEARLRATLPGHMVPSRFGVIDVLPTNRSGKLDRAALPDVGVAPHGEDRARVAPADEVERRVAAAVRRVLALGTDVSTGDDFFLDLGGTSLSAAEVVSALRGDPTTAGVTVRDVYEARTVAGIAARARVSEPPAPGPMAATRLPRPGPGRATAVQTAWLLLTLLVASLAAYAAWFVVAPFVVRRVGVVAGVLLLPLLGFAVLLVYTAVSVGALWLAKRVLIGRYRPIRAPVWGAFHVRHWVVRHVAGAVPWGWLADTVFLNAVLRLLGARIGRRVHVHRGADVAQGGWDLLDLGDDATVSQDAALRLVALEDGHVVVGPVTLGAGATLDVRAGASPDTVLGPGAWLCALSWLPPGSRVPAGERWDGVPAAPAGRAPEVPTVPAGGRVLSPALHGALTILLRFARGAFLYYASFVALAAIFVAPSSPSVSDALSWWFDPTVGPLRLSSVLALAALLVGSLPVSAVLSALSVRALGRVEPGVVSRWSPAYLRILAKTDAVRGAGELLSGTLFWPLWLRLAGMRVGRRCEISTIVDVVPELVEIGRETFLADGIYLGGPRVHAGTVAVERTRLGDANFLGNHVVVPAGTRLCDDVLVGVSTVVDDARIRPGTSWFGHPAFELPRREVVEVDRRLTHAPSLVRVVTRLSWECARFAIPVLPLLVLCGWLEAAAALRAAVSPPAFLLAALPGVTLLAVATLCAAVVALKWALLGRVRPAQHPLWSCWCSRWDFLYVAWGAYARRALGHLEGTLLLAGYLRAMGCRIGRGVVLGRGFAHVVDPDMLHLEDGATVDGLFQAHSFEDRVLKIDRVFVRRGATVGSGAVLLYGADVGERTEIAPHSVVMKHERLLPDRRYAGCPTAPTRAG